MNITALSIALSLLQAAPAQESDAEKLFKKMEERITSAKTLQFTAKMEVEDKAASSDVSVCTLGEGNRLLIEYRNTLGGATSEGRVVSDGEFVMDTSRAPAPADMGAVIRLAVARMHFGTLAGMIKLKKEEVSKALTPSEIKSGGREKIGGVEAEIVDYVVKLPMTGKCALRVWIDPTTFLPLKRTVTMPSAGSDPLKGTTTYEGFKIDEKIDDAKFKLP